ncbi:hypothetical protein [Falsarthrobacter nasiphocae]|uniref:Uncharacterized protein n=1 Tax=Falsarthrobacter nasiphocae TaxID=189863 RepID=A0AAE3YDI4_9MICC|nr:hypothetical protein [Falsarthrobacter nasiphocae]MDR6891389.1 hypothetical protein [Falsarthrobacter nasiphocae]
MLDQYVVQETALHARATPGCSSYADSDARDLTCDDLAARLLQRASSLAKHPDERPVSVDTLEAADAVLATRLRDVVVPRLIDAAAHLIAREAQAQGVVARVIEGASGAIFLELGDGRYLDLTQACGAQLGSASPTAFSDLLAQLRAVSPGA